MTKGRICAESTPPPLSHTSVQLPQEPLPPMPSQAESRSFSLCTTAARLKKLEAWSWLPGSTRPLGCLSSRVAAEKEQTARNGTDQRNAQRAGADPVPSVNVTLLRMMDGTGLLCPSSELGVASTKNKPSLSGKKLKRKRRLS